MEAMEVDVQFGAAEPVGSGGLEVPIIIPDSGSSTEVEEDEEADGRPEGERTAPATRPRLAATQIVRRRRARCEHESFAAGFYFCRESLKCIHGENWRNGFMDEQSFQRSWCATCEIHAT